MDWECVPHRIKPLALDGGFGVGGCPSAYKWAIRLKLNYTTLRLSDAVIPTMMMRKPNEGILNWEGPTALNPCPLSSISLSPPPFVCGRPSTSAIGWSIQRSAVLLGHPSIKIDDIFSSRREEAAPN